MRVGIVNDLALAREVLRRVVVGIPGYSVAWLAEDGDVAVARAAADRPDVVLMDLVMPKVDGVEATRRIMRECPCPVLVVTASVSTNYALACRAMGAGAIDAVETPTFGPGGGVQHAEKLVARLAQLEAELADLSASGLMAPIRAPAAHGVQPLLVLLGASTGGPEALAHVVSAFPKEFPAAVLIAQHIAADFAPALVQQLATYCRLPVRAAKNGDAPEPGTVYVAASNDHLELASDGALRYTPNPLSSPYRPSVDVLFASCAARAVRLGAAALLTGMGRDGAEGLLRLRAAGWHTIAQDEATSVVKDGMPKAAVEKRAAVEVLPLQLIGETLAAKVAQKSR
jgi:two-component system, chemotaxis family, response regulator WspF